MPSTSLFGIACTRQINSNRLKNRSPDVTRSTVQKAVVVLTGEPGQFGQLRQRLSVVTNAWFAQEFVWPWENTLAFVADQSIGISRTLTF